MAHVFISYVRENSDIVDRLSNELARRGVKVWLDRNEIQPGYNWKISLAEAIDRGDFFIACFSAEYNEKTKTYMNEELTLAIEQLRQRPDNAAWFIPVLLSGKVPNRRIDASRQLTDIQWVELNEAHWDRGLRHIFGVIRPGTIRLRSTPIANLSEEEVKKMLKERDFFDSEKFNLGEGVQHYYELLGSKNEKVVVDHTTGLTWQQSGSNEKMKFKQSEKYIHAVSRQEFAGYSDWRLPTLEEAMSLMESSKSEHDFYIDPVFDNEQIWIWTADTKSVYFPPDLIQQSSGVSLPVSGWHISFYRGSCSSGFLTSAIYVRAVR